MTVQINIAFVYYTFLKIHKMALYYGHTQFCFCEHGYFDINIQNVLLGIRFINITI